MKRHEKPPPVQTMQEREAYYQERNPTDMPRILKENAYRLKEVAKYTRHHDLVLDVGCAGIPNPFLRGAVVGLDIITPLVWGDGEFIKADVQELVSGQVARFDRVVMSETLEHLTDPLKALRLLQSYLLPGGKIVVTTPNILSPQKILNAVRGLHYENLNHIIEYNTTTLKNALYFAGFHDVKVYGIGLHIPFLYRFWRRTFQVKAPLFTEILVGVGKR